MSWIWHFDIMTQECNIHRNGKHILHHLANATIQIANLGHDYCHPREDGKYLSYLTLYTVIMYSFIQQGATESFDEQAEVSVKTNFWGTLNVCNSLFPLLRPHARLDYPCN